MTKNDTIQNGRRLFEKLYISTQKRKTQVNKISLISVDSYYQGLLHKYIILLSTKYIQQSTKLVFYPCI